MKATDEQAREAERAYQRRWRAAHPEKCREYKRRFWSKRAEQLAAENATGPQRKDSDPS